MLASAATATTPVKRSDAKVNRTAQLQRVAKPQALQQVNSKRTPGSPLVNKAPKREAFLENWYNRPAGAFYCDAISVDGAYGYAYSTPFLFAKPFTDYTFYGFCLGADENTHLAWDVFKYDGGENYYPVDDAQDVTVNYSMEISQVPRFYAVDGEFEDEHATWYEYQIIDHGMGGSYEAPVVESETPINVFAIPSEKIMNDDGSEVDYWGSSKTMVGGGREGKNYYLYTYYSGAEPAPGNDNGWWFGKNGSHIDGIAQAFEKPTSPYLLKKIGMYTAVLELLGDNAKMTCKVYKLNEIPAYNDTSEVVLPLVPGELIVSGEATVTESTIQDNYGFVEFTLFGQDEEDPELTYEYTPTIDYPILVVIDGYNENAALQDFSVCISNDDEVDEGYGELAYLKYPRRVVSLDENGDTIFNDEGKPVYEWTGDYIGWCGLNNFFTSGEMKTALTIFVCTENPFITFNYSIEDGEHTFPNEGGELVKYVEYEGETYAVEGIDFYSWYGADDYVLTYKGSDELPEWLSIELEDVEGDEYSGWEVYAAVTAEPLPENVPYREAVIRFEIPGDFIEYKFMQGEPMPFLPEDVNHDGEVTVADVNMTIGIILAGTNDPVADVNGDGEVTVADVNRVIAYIVGN